MSYLEGRGHFSLSASTEAAIALWNCSLYLFYLLILIFLILSSSLNCNFGPWNSFPLEFSTSSSWSMSILEKRACSLTPPTHTHYKRQGQYWGSDELMNRRATSLTLEKKNEEESYYLSRRCRPSMENQTHIQPSKSARTAWHRSRRRTEGNHTV